MLPTFKTAFGLIHQPTIRQGDRKTPPMPMPQPASLKFSTNSQSSWPTNWFTNQPPNPNLTQLGWLLEKFHSEIHQVQIIPISWKFPIILRKLCEKSPAFLVTGCLPVCRAGLTIDVVIVQTAHLNPDSPPVQTGYPLWDVVAVKKMCKSLKWTQKLLKPPSVEKVGNPCWVNHPSSYIQWTCLMLKDALIPSSNNLSFQPYTAA